MINIRKAKEEDVEVFVKLRMELFRELGEIVQDTDIVALEIGTKEYFIKNINHSFICWLAECDGQVVGSAGLNTFQRIPYAGNLLGLEGYIMNIYTLPQYRRKGIAISLVKKIIDYSKENNINRLWLHASDEGRYVYSKLGFKSKGSEMDLTW